MLVDSRHVFQKARIKFPGLRGQRPRHQQRQRRQGETVRGFYPREM